MSLYTEKSTSLLYEAKLFEEFVIVRPVTPGFEQHLTRMSHTDFVSSFDEFCGRHDEVYSFIEGSEGIELVSGDHR